MFYDKTEVFCYDFNEKRIYLTETEMNEKDSVNYNDKAFLYADINLSKKSSTDNLKKMYTNKKASNGRKQTEGIYNSAKNIIKDSTQRYVEIFGVMSQLIYYQK
ncbi:hypothetical protein [Ruminiclostridium papyrosolvens]|uniref:Uncharacterized protein n=1 Tax=Ruminiclostridium papyrosolvens C7 TaxID=1330534 RepID=U4R1I4_9FIRM|nr:hypothetical protein [Ruminiclostridium papyrosolvens]EPR10535.1 hypothetical protein L323_13165 [Ruminiclostridium papyrosolvens C7]